MGEGCSFGLLYVSPLAFVDLCASFPFGFDGGMWEVIVLIPDHCLSSYSTKWFNNKQAYESLNKQFHFHMKMGSVYSKTHMKFSFRI